MSLTPGTRLGVYQVTAQIGEGGMGQVYRATDTKLKRQVAIKILPPSLAADADRLARFQREAEVLASLNHPNIAAIHGLEESGGITALVMELVEGEDLSALIARGAIPIDEALPIAKQVAEALEAAHEQGIVHRDLKPANIKVRADGTVKVLDFGLAKALDQGSGVGDHGSGAAANSPTITTPAMTMRGVILGTAAYMAPEQAKGKAVDKRADIWAFGAVLYEMLTGRRAFDADDTAEVLAAVLRQDIDWSHLPATTPPRVRRLLERCLDRDAKNRLRDIGEARLALSRVLAGEIDAAGSLTPSATTRRWPVGWIAACGVLVLTLTGLAAVHFAETPPPPASEMRLEISTPGTSRPSDFALSPDGSSVVFVAASGGVSRLWLRHLDRTDARPLTGTDGAQNPFWSADGASIGFFAGTKLKRMAASGGAPTTLADANPRFGGTWNTDGDIVFDNGRGLARINESGGAPSPVFAPELRFRNGWYPAFAPDGVHFLFLDTAEAYTLVLGSVDGSAPKRLGAADSQAAWLAPDRILYALQGKLVAQRLDIQRGELIGDPETVAETVGVEGFRGAFSVAANGRLAYRSGPFADQWVWVDRSGKPTGTAVAVGLAGVTSATLAPDGRRAVLDVNAQGNRDVFVADLVRGGTTRFTFDPTADGIPIWSPDGRTIAFESRRKGNFDIYLRPADGSGAETLLVEAPEGQWPQDWSKDGAFLLYFSGRDQVLGEQQLLALPFRGPNRTPIAVSNGLQGKFSPDGRWVAYQTQETGRWEIVVQAFPTPRGKWQVSTAGGTSPRWRDDGKELYFVADTTLMAAAIQAEGSSFSAAAPVPLFEIRDTTISGGARSPYDVARDGRFFLNHLTDAALSTPITLVLNWRGSTR